MHSLTLNPCEISSWKGHISLKRLGYRKFQNTEESRRKETEISYELKDHQFKIGEEILIDKKVKNR